MLKVAVLKSIDVGKFKTVNGPTIVPDFIEIARCEIFAIIAPGN